MVALSRDMVKDMLPLTFLVKELCWNIPDCQVVSKVEAVTALLGLKSTANTFPNSKQ